MVSASRRQRRDSLGAGLDAEARQPDPRLPLVVEVTGRLGRAPLVDSLAARVTLQEAISSCDEPWATAWSDSIVRAGLLKNADSDAVKVLITDVRGLLDRLDRLEPLGISRTELAASLYGSAHALDRGTKRPTAVTHALRYKMLAQPTCGAVG